LKWIGNPAGSCLEAMIMIRILAVLAAATWATAALADEPFKVPDGYTLQILEPTGGKIARPNGWFYSEGGSPVGYTWTISREDPRDGWYQVGLRIQVFAEVQQGTGMSPEAFIQNIVLERKHAAARVISECSATTQGLFQRRCLETEEILPAEGGTRRFHIQYSLFWPTGGDMAVVTTFGAPVEEWASVYHFANVMANFDLIDPSRFTE
jgi:hypothetical protein